MARRRFPYLLILAGTATGFAAAAVVLLTGPRHGPRPAVPNPVAANPVAANPVAVIPPDEGLRPLAVGQRAPALNAGGWLNGPPPRPGPGGPRAIVVDFLGLW